MLKFGMGYCLFIFIAGLAASEWFSHFLFYALFAINLVALFAAFFNKWARPFFQRWLIFSIIFALGFFYSLAFEKVFHSWELPTELIKKNVVVEGRIASIPKQTSRFSQFEFLTDHFNAMPLTVRLKLSWYNTAPVLAPGEKCIFSVRLKPSHGLKNPGSFDFEKYLRSNHIPATGYVVDKKNPQCQHNFSWNLLTIRKKIQDTIVKAISSNNVAGLIAALTVGSRTEMSQTQWKTLQNTGTSHLMAISGLHVAFIAGLIYGVMNFLWRASPFLLRRFPAQKAGALLSMLGAILYGFLAGFSLPTQRAVIMIIVLIGFEFFNKSTNVTQRLLWAATIILIFQPLGISQASFWLSFAAVAWICFGMMGYQHFSKWKLWLRVQWVCFVGLLPITLLYFQQISVVSFVANTIAIPWVGFVIVPLCFVASLLMIIHVKLSQGLFTLIGYLFWPLWKILIYLGSLHFAVWHHSLLNIFVFASCWIAVTLFLAPKALPGRALAWIFVLPLFFYFPEKPKAGEVWLTVLDVGQGLATVIQTQHHTLVYDTGPKTYGGFDSGESVVLPFLRRSNIKNLDSMIISHGDNDHIGGMRAILAALSTRELLTSEPQKLADFSAKSCVEGQQWTWDGVHFTMLNPPKNSEYLRNNSSCVLQIRAHGKVLLLPADIEKEGEKRLVEQYAGQLKADVLLAPHHGSKTSSTEAFLKAVDPKYVIAANGFYNAFHFPSAEILARYAAFHVKLFDTAKEGAIQVRIESSGQLKIKAMQE